jgi:DNA repair ATPase RecN
MDDRHADKELSFREIQRLGMEDYAMRNATAVKHVASRIALLGDEATPEHLHRLEEEQTALERLAKKHEADMRNLVRYQESKKLELLRKQEKAYEVLSKSLETSLENQRKEKTAKLQYNISRLDDMVEERRAKLIARFFIRLQVLKAMNNDTAAVDAALPLSLLRLPAVFTAGLGYS